MISRLTLLTVNEPGDCHISFEPIWWVKSGYMFRGANGPIEKLEKLHQVRVIVYIQDPGRPSLSLPQTKSKLQGPSNAYISTSQNKSDLRLNTWSISLHRKSLKEKFKSLVGPRCTRGKICVWRNVNTVWRRSGAGSGTKEEMTESFLNGKSFSIEIAFLPQLWSCYVLKCPNSNNLYDHSNL